MCMNPSAEVLDGVRQKGYAITARDFFRVLMNSSPRGNCIVLYISPGCDREKLNPPTRSAKRGHWARTKQTSALNSGFDSNLIARADITHQLYSISILN